MTDIEPYSPEALEKQRRVRERVARGETPSWSDLRGIYEPNPDLLDCQAWDGGYDHKCQLDKGHDGPHRHVIEWGG